MEVQIKSYMYVEKVRQKEGLRSSVSFILLHNNLYIIETKLMKLPHRHPPSFCHEQVLMTTQTERENARYRKDVEKADRQMQEASKLGLNHNALPYSVLDLWRGHCCT